MLRALISMFERICSLSNDKVDIKTNQKQQGRHLAQIFHISSATAWIIVIKDHGIFRYKIQLG